MGEVLLGIDIGTASTKGVLTAPDGEVLARASRSHTMSLPRPGWAEVDADEVWWADVVAVCQELMEETTDVVAALCVSGVGPCLLVCDEQAKPLRPAILYGIDMRATREIGELTDRFGGDAILERGGTALTSQAVGPKMAWLRREEPDVWKQAERWYNSNSFVVARLTGEYVLDHHTASQCDPLYDMAAQAWSEDWVDEVAPGIAMPDLAWPGEVVGRVHEAAAEQTGLPVGTPVCAGTIDAWAEAFSAGVRHPGDLMLMYGSTMFFVQVTDELRADAMLWSTSGVERGSHTLAAGMATSGSLTEWINDLSGDVGFERLVEEAAKTPPGADGLLMLPYFAGERTPVFDARARGVVAGLTLRHSRAHLFRAAYEGIAFGVRQILELFDGADRPASRLVAVGGGTAGGLWTQIVSDVTGRDQMVPRETIGASYGDALLAAMAVDLAPPDADWTEEDRTVRPDTDNRERYDTLFDAFRELYPATRDVVHTLADLQEDGLEPA